MISSNKQAKLAGLLYLVVVISGIFSLAYVPKLIINWDSPEQTVNQLMAHEMMFRFSLLAGIICYVAFAFLPWILFNFLSPVHKMAAQLMVGLAMVSIPMSFVNIINKYCILDLIHSFKAAAIESVEMQQRTMQYFQQYNNGILVTTIFWGLWLLPFGYLVYASQFLPKLLGVLLMLGCMGYLVNFTGNTIYPDYGESYVSTFFALFPTVGELSICFWLLLIGIKQTKSVTS